MVMENMTKNQILDIGLLVSNGQLFRPDTDRDRIEAYLPPMGRENHGSNLMELPNGDLLCVWFGGDKEGAKNVSIALSRLSPNATQWTTPVFVSDDPTRSDQNPVLFVTPEGTTLAAVCLPAISRAGTRKLGRKILQGRGAGDPLESMDFGHSPAGFGRQRSHLEANGNAI